MRFQENGLSSMPFNPRYVRRKEAGVQEIGGTRRGNGEKRRKESLPDASAWISVGISVATLFYVRDTVWATRGECVGVWRKASVRQPLRFLPRCHQTNRTVCDVVHSRSRYSCLPRGSYSCRTHTPTRTRVHAAVFARVSSPTNVSARTGIAGIRGICKIPTAHVTTNCCSADRPTHRRSVKTLNLLSFVSLLPSLFFFFPVSSSFCRMRDKPIHIRTESRRRERRRREEKKEERELRASDSFFHAADVMTVLVANCRALAATRSDDLSGIA